eukprot:jgi/Antlo1/1941/719
MLTLMTHNGHLLNKLPCRNLLFKQNPLLCSINTTQTATIAFYTLALGRVNNSRPINPMSTSDDSIEYSSSSIESEQDNPWIEDFMMLAENRALVRVPQEFIEDRFNLVGLGKDIQNVERGLRVILGDLVDTGACKVRILYYMIHQRYIFTKQGLEEVFERVIQGDYGVCRNIACASAKLIPMGLTDLPEISTVKLYCYNCKLLFHPTGGIERLDACAFGRSFPHFLVMTYKNHFPKSKYGKYIPRIFGFRVFEDDR